MKRGASQHRMDGLIALLLFAVFAACVLTVLFAGANAYRRLVQRDQAAYERRTCVQYIAARVRQADCLGGVSVSRLEDTLALTLDQGDGYLTQVYYYGGRLMELYAASDAGLSPEDGRAIMEISGLELSMEDSLLTVSVTGADGARDTLRLSLRSGEGAAP